MAEYRKGYKVDPTTGLTQPEARAGLTREHAEADAAAEAQSKREGRRAPETQSPEATAPAADTTWMHLPSSRSVLIVAAAFIVGAALGASLSAYGASSHYRSEHKAAARERAEHSALLAEVRSAQDAARKDEKVAASLQNRLDKTRRGVAYASARWRRQKRTSASLRTSLSAANASAKSSYSTGYDKGYADALDSVASGSGSGGGTSPGDCDPNYEGACVPTGYGDVNCADVTGTDFYVTGEDIYGLDGDGDGIACES